MFEFEGKMKKYITWFTDSYRLSKQPGLWNYLCNFKHICICFLDVVLWLTFIEVLFDAHVLLQSHINFQVLQLLVITFYSPVFLSVSCKLRNIWVLQFYEIFNFHFMYRVSTVIPDHITRHANWHSFRTWCIIGMFLSHYM